MQASERPVDDSSNASVGRLVVRNTLFLTAAQVITIPISIGVSALTARYLGPVEFGYIYIATTLCGFGFLAVEWGQTGVLPAAIAREHEKAPRLLGTSLAWRSVLCVFVYLALAFGCHIFGYGVELEWALGIMFAVSLASSFASAFKDAIRGFERTDLPAYSQVGQQVLIAIFTAAVLIAGGRLRAALLAQLVAGVLTLWLLWLALRLVGVRTLAVDRKTLGPLLREGTPFVFFGLAMALQPNIDTLYLSKLAPPEVMGWFAVSRRLIGQLLFPASALLSALYPTLCRLYTSDLPAFVRTTRGSLASVALLVVPVALGCLLYPEIGISIFSRKSFGPAEDNLRISSLFIFLVYFTMPLGICILAAGKQRAWSIVQSLCIVVSLVLDPVLVPWFQTRNKNGGLGLSLAGVLSEVLVVACGVALAPRGIFDRRFARLLALALVSGAAMAVVAHALRAINSFIAAPIALCAYGVALVLTGAVEKQQIQSARAIIARKLSRAR
jgi:O-antigen/teichoic acid export membrane protein